MIRDGVVVLESTTSIEAVCIVDTKYLPVQVDRFLLLLGLS